MGQLNLNGQILAGPPQSGGNGFPAASFNVPLQTLQTPKGFQVGTGVLTQIVNSPSAFVPLNGVATDAAVTQGDFLYLKVNAAVILRITTDDGAGGTNIVEVPVHGVIIMEFPTLNALEVLEVQGTGTVEYLVTGQS